MTTVLFLLVSNTLAYAAPLILTSIGGTFSERGGVVNVGLEGIMVMGAFSAAVYARQFESGGSMTPWMATLVAGLVGMLFSVIHALATINFRADHVVSGTVLNLIAPSLAVFLIYVMYNERDITGLQATFRPFTFPLLSGIPFLGIGKIFFTDTSLLAYLAILVSFVAWFVLFKTTFGLRLRSVGEHPQAADTLGINVYVMRYSGVLISGFLGGMGGAIYALTNEAGFRGTTIAGVGFIALAAMIFGRWNPVGAMLSCLFFGFSQALASVSQQIDFLKSIPRVFFNIAPYLLTIVVLTLFFGKSAAPKADGENYIKTK